MVLPATGNVDGRRASERDAYDAGPSSQWMFCISELLDGSRLTSTFDLGVHAPTAQALRYAIGDLTDQQFIDRCELLIDRAG